MILERFCGFGDGGGEEAGLTADAVVARDGFVGGGIGGVGWVGGERAAIKKIEGGGEEAFEGGGLGGGIEGGGVCRGAGENADAGFGGGVDVGLIEPGDEG